MNRAGRLHLIAWTCSILFHCALISFGVYFLVKPATFTVTAGETSTENRTHDDPIGASADPVTNSAATSTSFALASSSSSSLRGH
jgi:hypothetical protein